jgi:hypothetical protein
LIIGAAAVSTEMTAATISVSVSAAVADAGVVADEVAGSEMSSGSVVSSIEGAIGAGFTSLSVSFISLDRTAGTAVAADAVAGAVADAAAGVSIGTEMSSDSIVLDTGGVIGANFTSLLVSFVFSDTIVVAATDAAADTVTGALVGVEKTDDAVLNTGGVFGAVFTLLSISFTASCMTAATAASVVMPAGEATDAVTGESVGTERFLDDAVLGTSGVFLSEASK